MASRWPDMPEAPAGFTEASWRVRSVLRPTSSTNLIAVLLEIVPQVAGRESQMVVDFTGGLRLESFLGDIEDPQEGKYLDAGCRGRDLRDGSARQKSAESNRDIILHNYFLHRGAVLLPPPGLCELTRVISPDLDQTTDLGSPSNMASHLGFDPLKSDGTELGQDLESGFEDGVEYSTGKGTEGGGFELIALSTLKDPNAISRHDTSSSLGLDALGADDFGNLELNLLEPLTDRVARCGVSIADEGALDRRQAEQEFPNIGIILDVPQVYHWSCLLLRWGYRGWWLQRSCGTPAGVGALSGSLTTDGTDTTPEDAGSCRGLALCLFSKFHSSNLQSLPVIITYPSNFVKYCQRPSRRALRGDIFLEGLESCPSGGFTKELNLISNNETDLSREFVC